MEIKIAEHCALCINYKANHGSSMKSQDGVCKLHNFKTHNRYVCSSFTLVQNMFVTKLNNQINTIYGNI